MIRFGLPQVILIALVAVNLAFHLALHGKPRGNYNIFGMLFDANMMFFLLWWGGFFK